MEVTFAKEYSAILKELLHYLGLRRISRITFASAQKENKRSLTQSFSEVKRSFTEFLRKMNKSLIRRF